MLFLGLEAPLFVPGFRVQNEQLTLPLLHWCMMLSLWGVTFWLVSREQYILTRKKVGPRIPAPPCSPPTKHFPAIDSVRFFRVFDGCLPLCRKALGLRLGPTHEGQKSGEHLRCNGGMAGRGDPNQDVVLWSHARLCLCHY